MINHYRAALAENKPTVNKRPSTRLKEQEESTLEAQGTWTEEIQEFTPRFVSKVEDCLKQQREL